MRYSDAFSLVLSLVIALPSLPFMYNARVKYLIEDYVPHIGVFGSRRSRLIVDGDIYTPVSVHRCLPLRAKHENPEASVALKKTTRRIS